MTTEELVSVLREEAEAVKAIEWEIPICTENHILDAVDTIRRLQQERDHFRHEAQRLWRKVYCESCCEWNENGGCQREFVTLKGKGVRCLAFDRCIE